MPIAHSILKKKKINELNPRTKFYWAGPLKKSFIGLLTWALLAPSRRPTNDNTAHLQFKVSLKRYVTITTVRV